jgi:hypothetical protein
MGKVIRSGAGRIGMFSLRKLVDERETEVINRQPV